MAKVGQVGVIVGKAIFVAFVLFAMAVIASSFIVDAEAQAPSSCTIDYTLSEGNPNQVFLSGHCTFVQEAYYPIDFGDGLQPQDFMAYVDGNGDVAKTQNWQRVYICPNGNCTFTVSLKVGEAIFTKEVIVNPRTFEPPFCTIDSGFVGEDPFSRLFVVACDNTAEGYYPVTFGDGTGFDMNLVGGVAEFPHSYACDSTSCAYTIEVKIGELVFSKEVIITPPTESAIKVYLPLITMRSGPPSCTVIVANGSSSNERTLKVLYQNVSPNTWWEFTFGDGTRFDILYPTREGETVVFGHAYPWDGSVFKATARVGQGINDFCSAEVSIQ